MKTNPLSYIRASNVIDVMTGESLHAKRLQSLTNAVVGVTKAVSLSIHAIGAGLAEAIGLNPKHAIKQVDRLLSNSALSVWGLLVHWVPYVLASSKEIVVALDWTEFDGDNHSTIALYLVTSNGRATPLVWKTVKKSALRGRRNKYEDDVIRRLHDTLPPGVRVTLLADRGFGDQKLYEFLTELGFEFVIRFRGVVAVEASDGAVRTAAEWVPANGRVRQLREAKVTADRFPLDSVVCVKAKGMKAPWCLAVRGARITGTNAVKLYGRRFTIEETFRDTKNARYGLGMSATHIGDVDRRDRLLLISAMAIMLLTTLGAAGESLGMDRMLKANTVKKRTHSLLRQGCHYYNALPNMKTEAAVALLKRFGEFVLQQPFYTHAYGLK